MLPKRSRRRIAIASAACWSRPNFSFRPQCDFLQGGLWSTGNSDRMIRLSGRAGHHGLTLRSARTAKPICLWLRPAILMPAEERGLAPGRELRNQRIIKPRLLPRCPVTAGRFIVALTLAIVHQRSQPAAGHHRQYCGHAYDDVTVKRHRWCRPPDRHAVPERGDEKREQHGHEEPLSLVARGVLRHLDERSWSSHQTRHGNDAVARAIGASEPLPTATPATAIPSANPAAPARRWSTPLRSRSQLHLRHEIRQRLGLPGIGGAGVARATATKWTPIAPTAAVATVFHAKPRKVLRVKGSSSYFSCYAIVVSE